MTSDYILRKPLQIRWGLFIVAVVSGAIAAILSWLVRPVYRQQVAQSAHWRVGWVESRDACTAADLPPRDALLLR